MREPVVVFIPSIILMSLTIRPDLLGPCGRNLSCIQPLDIKYA
jgi:hypothetical protein